MTIKNGFERWLERESVPTFRGYSVSNLKELDLEYWDKMGGDIMYLLLEGMEGTNISYVAEVPAGKSLNVERHLYEEVIYVLKGRGTTTVWYDENKKRTFEWKAGSVYIIPPNAYHQIFNGSGSEPARFYAVTTGPLIMNLFHNDDFVFNNDFHFNDRFNDEEDFFNGEGVSLPGRVWETNFVADVGEIPLILRKERGPTGEKNIILELGNNTLIAHISEFPVGTYKKAHRHRPGANVVIVSGEGYSLLWNEGEEKRKIDWQPGSVLVPPNMTFHQHFNTGATPARYLAIRYGSTKHPFLKSYTGDKSMKDGGNQIEYEDQDPIIEEIFNKELAKKGVQSKMAMVMNSKS
jgi:oxalate decarboxylase/phosphoglucose isomerase-like protein (cupin superfamily)